MMPPPPPGAPSALLCVGRMFSTACARVGDILARDTVWLPQALAVHSFRTSSSCETQTELVHPEPARAQSPAAQPRAPSHTHRLPLVDEGDSDRAPDPQPPALRDPGASPWKTGQASASELRDAPPAKVRAPFALLSCLWGPSPADHAGLGTSVRRCRQDPASRLSQPPKGLEAARPGTPRQVCGVRQAPAPEGLSRGVG